jgi:predicted RNA binding protein with dsRBD fold (UPF0201 family)
MVSELIYKLLESNMSFTVKTNSNHGDLSVPIHHENQDTTVPKHLNPQLQDDKGMTTQP